MPYLTLNVAECSQHRILKSSSGTLKEETRSPTAETSSTISSSNNAADESPIGDFPIMKLDIDIITDATAARLATSLLGHILFLKNQVPLPVVQLARISNAKTNPRTLKQRQDLLNSFDTISSHLETTFSALSTAFARSHSHGDSESSLAVAYLAFLVGPGIRTAKARVIFGIDGLERRIWGSRDDSHPLDVGDDANADDGDDWEEHAECNEAAEEPDDSEEETDEDGTCSDDSESDPEPSRPEPVLYISRAEEQKFLQNADRLLSRVLANADANGKGMSSEMAPTQTHILLRAPRRFVHPAWIPYQSGGAFLDGLLGDFLRGSGRREHSNLPVQRPGKGPKVEGVWITTQSGILSSVQEETKSTINNEEDELIWWTWDGKLVGFSDW